jgi:hypothetical protein
MLVGIDYDTAQCLRAASSVGLFPTKVIQGFVETFCISALEYEALGVPILATAVGGVPEATPGEAALVPPDSPVGLWWNRLTELLACRTVHAVAAREFSRNFTSAQSAARILDIAALGSQRRAAPMKTFLPSRATGRSHPSSRQPRQADRDPFVRPPHPKQPPCPPVPLDNGSAGHGHRGLK